MGKDVKVVYGLVEVVCLLGFLFNEFYVFGLVDLLMIVWVGWIYLRNELYI